MKVSDVLSTFDKITIGETELLAYKEAHRADKSLSLQDYIKKSKFPLSTSSKPLVITLDNLDEKGQKQPIAGFNFSGCDFSGIQVNCSFDRCTFKDTKMRDCALAESSFNNCTLIDTDLRGVTGLESTKITYDKEYAKAVPISERFSGIKLSVAEIFKTKLEEDQQKVEQLQAKKAQLEKEVATRKAEIKRLSSPTLMQDLSKALSTNPILTEDIDAQIQANKALAKEKRKEIVKVKKDLSVVATKAQTVFDPTIGTLFKERKAEELRIAKEREAEIAKAKAESERANSYLGFGFFQKTSTPVEVPETTQTAPSLKPLIVSDASYVRYSSQAELDEPKVVQKLNREDFDEYLSQCAESTTKVSLSEFTKEKYKLDAGKEGVIPDLSGIELKGKTISNADMRGAIFAGANLDKASFENCDISQANFDGASLQSTKFKKVAALESKFLFSDMSSVTMNNCDFSRATMTKVDLERGKITNCRFEYTNLVLANGSNLVYTGGSLKGASASRSCLDGLQATDVKMKSMDLAGGCLSGASVTKCTLTSSEMSGSSTIGAVFQDTNMERIHGQGIDMSNTLLAGSTSLQNSELQGSTFQETSAQGVSFAGSKMDKADLTAADLQRAGLQNVSAQFATLDDANISEANARGIDLSSAKGDDLRAVSTVLTEATLEKFEATRSDFTDAIANKANMRDAVFDGSNLTKVQATEAQTEGLDLDNSKVTGMNIGGSTVNIATKLSSNGEMTKASVTNSSTGKTQEVQELQAQQAQIDQANSKGFLRKGVDKGWNWSKEFFGEKLLGKISSYLPTNTQIKAVAIGIGVVAGLAAAGVAAPYVLPVLAGAGVGTVAATAVLYGGSLVVGGIVGYKGKEAIHSAIKYVTKKSSEGLHWCGNKIGISSKETLQAADIQKEARVEGQQVAQQREEARLQVIDSQIESSQYKATSLAANRMAKGRLHAQENPAQQNSFYANIQTGLSQSQEKIKSMAATVIERIKSQNPADRVSEGSKELPRSSPAKGSQSHKPESLAH
ncbi:MAG: pentapeptide repeat-containing protein [Rickettsiaceae bacterium]|nr:pentapeptide repeat-containing protein [Rickettsiaceae bacterium]